MRFLLIVAMLALLATPAAAQRLAERAGLTQPVRRAATRWEASFARDSVPPNQWKKGAAIGAGVGAAVGLLLVSWANAIDESNRSHVPYLIAPIFIFALIGGMIGSGSNK